jgi:transcriptional regulator with XRE-family HTH domain
MVNTNPRSRSTAPLTEVRAYRLRLNVTMAEAAVASGIPMARLSQIERQPDAARDGEIEALHAAVDRVAASRGGAE